MLKSKSVFVSIFFIFISILLTAEENQNTENQVKIVRTERLVSIDSLTPKRSNITFREYESYRDNNFMAVSAGKKPEDMFFKYTNTENFTLQGLAARCCIRYETIATLNGIESSHDDITGKTLILPTVNGLFIPTGKGKSSLEQLLQSNYENKDLTKLDPDSKSYYNIDGRDYLFLLNEKLSPTERAYFLDSSLCLPLDIGTYWVSSEFGKRKNPLSGKIKNHNGIDLAAPVGTPVYAIKEGAAYSCVYGDPTFGNYIILSHDSGKMTSVYAHLSEICIERYQSVKKGDIIGYVGQTGMATGPHLHFEIREGGVAEDPRLKLQLGD